MTLLDKKLTEALQVLLGERGDKTKRAVRHADLDGYGGSLRNALARAAAVEKLTEKVAEEAAAGNGAALEAAAEALAEAQASAADALAALNAAIDFRLAMLARLQANAIRTTSGENGVGDWSGATVSTDIPAHAPGSARSIQLGATSAEGPAYNEDAYGRTFRITGWIKKTSGQVNFRLRGSAVNDPNERTLIALQSTAAATVTATGAWQEIDVTIKVTAHTTHWVPAVSQTGLCTTFGLRWHDITGIVQRLEVLEASVPGGLTASVTQHAAALSDLQGNAGAFTSLIAELSNGQIAGFRAMAFNNAAAGISSSLLELIGASVIAEGSMTVGKLTVGLGKNDISNSRFRHGLAGWRLIQNGDAGADSTLSVRAAGSTHSGAFSPVLQVFQSSADATGFAEIRWYDSAAGPLSGVPCKTGDRIEASAYLSAHRCSCVVGIRWLDASGGIVDEDFGNAVTTSGDSANPDLWTRSFVLAAAPAGAVMYQIVMRKGATTSGGNSFLMVHKPMAAPTHAAATGPSPYSDDGAVLITSEGIAAAAVKAIHLDAVTLALAGLGIFGGTLQSSNFNLGTQTGWQLTQAGVFRAYRLIAQEYLMLNSVGTPELINFAATKGAYGAGYTALSLGGEFEVTVSHSAGSDLLIFAASDIVDAGQSIDGTMEIRRNGSRIFQRKLRNNGTLSDITAALGVSGTSSTIKVAWAVAGGLPGGTVHPDEIRIVVLERKK